MTTDFAETWQSDTVPQKIVFLKFLADQFVRNELQTKRLLTNRIPQTFLHTNLLIFLGDALWEVILAWFPCNLVGEWNEADRFIRRGEEWWLRFIEFRELPKRRDLMTAILLKLDKAIECHKNSVSEMCETPLDFVRIFSLGSSLSPTHCRTYFF